MRNNLKLDNIDDTKFKCKIYSHILKTMLNHLGPKESFEFS